MVQLTDQLILSQDDLSLYYCPDSHLSNLPVLIFHGPSTTTNSTLNSSRIQLHILTAAGFQSYPRITISPNSPFYESVNHLPQEKQGDELCRGVAFGLLKYFRELPEKVKSGFIHHTVTHSRKRAGSSPTIFGEQHAADIAASMVKVENIGEIIRNLEAALQPQHVHHLDVDLVLPPGSIMPYEDFDEHWEEDDYTDPVIKQYGVYAPLVQLFGEVTFLPTSRIPRAPSRPTSVNRSRTFNKEQKMSLRREMGELVDTEERYVIKMHELVNHIADDYRDKARTRSYGSSSPSEADLELLFPQSLDRIFQINSAFLRAIQKVMDETEEDAILDLESPLVGSNSSRHGMAGRAKDPTGAMRFAKTLLEWFPQFTECYQSYMHSSQNFPMIITSFMNQTSSFSQQVQQTGEQRLRSAIIEPVQRLPRYSLFIANIVNYLPVAHAAVPHMLRARDIITSICSMDPPTNDKWHVVNRLMNLVEAWPSSLHPQGRLITAVDFTELSPPYHDDSMQTAGSHGHGMLLIFADSVVILKKARDGKMSARGLVAEVDKPSADVMIGPVAAAAGGQRYHYELQFSGWHVLSDIRFTISIDGRCLWMASLNELRDSNIGRDRNQAATVRHFVLKGLYEGKAFKLTDEITKARLEGRFTESERESGEWAYRSITLPAAEISLHTAVFEEGVGALIEGRKEPAPIRIVVDHEKGTKGAPVGHYGVEIVASVKVIAGGVKYRLEVDGLNDNLFLDEVVPELVLATFAKRIVGLLGPQYNERNPALVPPFISRYTKILKSLQLHLEAHEKTRSFRPPSPVKMISNLLSSGFGGSSSALNASTSSQSKSGRVQMGDVPSIQAPPLQRSTSDKSTPSIQDVHGNSSAPANNHERPTNPLVRLEETFTGYVAALQSRKGNIVGRVMANRYMADELSINAVYNTFIEKPFDTRATSEVTVDVLFVAFEKYLRMAWRDQMGEVMPVQTLDGLQERATTLKSAEFAEYVKQAFGEMAPQNRRAFISIIKLLADLLEGCGNDGDRGALTASFAELLVQGAHPHNYINLIDRMVDDVDHLFEDIGPGAIAFGNAGSSVYGSISGARSNHSTTGSLTSNTSSLRKKFSLLRHNSSKNESDSRPSMWRTMSKNGRNAATGEVFTSSSMSKASVNHSRSIESPHRPISRDRPTVFGTFDERPASSHSPGNRLSTIGASPPVVERADPANSKKKSRRSSLPIPDMMKLSLGGSSPLTPEVPVPPNSLKYNGSPRTLLPTSRIPVSGRIMDRGRQMTYHTGAPAQKENVPLGMAPGMGGNQVERGFGASKQLSPGEGFSKSSPMASNIPTLRGTPRGRTPSSTFSRPISTSSKAEKFRSRSPEKLRERVDSESQSISDAETALRMELAQIHETIGRMNTMATTEPHDLAVLDASFNALRDRIPNMTKDLTNRLDAIKSDLEKGLQASEFKVKNLDQLYKEGSAENELLYEKFNSELTKIVKALKGRGRADKEDLVEKLKDHTEATAVMKKENARLKREILQLRTFLKGSE